MRLHLCICRSDPIFSQTGRMFKVTVPICLCIIQDTNRACTPFSFQSCQATRSNRKESCSMVALSLIIKREKNMSNYNYLHHRRRRLRAGIERKRCRIQRRRSQKSYRKRHEDNPALIQSSKSKRASFNSTFGHFSKGFMCIPSLSLYKLK